MGVMLMSMSMSVVGLLISHTTDLSTSRIVAGSSPSSIINPLPHRLPLLKMPSNMLLPLIPRTQIIPTKPTTPPRIPTLRHLLPPALRDVEKRRAMKILDMLAQMVGAVECAFVYLALRAFVDAVVFVEVVFGGVGGHAECATAAGPVGV